MRDRVLVNGSVWTGTRHVSAVAIRAGRVVAVGGDEVRAAVDSGAELIDLEGRRAIPGLIDSHVHVLRAGLNWNDLVRWDDGVTTLAEGLGRITAAARRLGPGRWLRVLGGWHPGQFDEGRGPTRAELDAAAPDNPVYVQLLYEEALLNTAAIAATLGDTDPPGGTIERDGSGTPTGRIRGAGAFGMVLGQVPPPSLAEQRSSTRAVQAEFNAAGLTGAIDPGGFGVTPDSYRALFDVWRSGEATLRTRLYLVPPTRGNEVAEMKEWIRFIQPMVGDDMLRYVGAGEILTFGCHDLEGLTDFRVGAQAKDDLREIVRTLARAGWNVHMHAVLDDTISDVLDVWEEVDAEMGLNGRYSLAHIEPISPANLERMRALGVGAGVQNRMMFRAADSAEVWGGDEVILDAPPLRDILDMGIPLGAGTDGTVVSPFDPWRSIWWLVTGRSLDGAPPRHARHRLTVEEALRAYTAGSAWLGLDEDRLGRLDPGMLADIAVLDRDPFAIEFDELPRVSADLTLVGGRIVHATGAFAGAAE
jgi:predicted amidohydrolase YtcJ